MNGSRESLNLFEHYDEIEDTGRVFFETEYALKGAPCRQIDHKPFWENEERLDDLARKDAFLNSCEEEYVIRFSNLTHMCNKMAFRQFARLHVALYEEKKQAIFHFDADDMVFDSEDIPLLTYICTLTHRMIVAPTPENPCHLRLEFSFLLYEDPETTFYRLFQKKDKT